MKRDKSRSETDLGDSGSLRGLYGIAKTARKLGILAPERVISLIRIKKLAEREGFEPSIRLPVCRISSAVHSTTLPPLRKVGVGAHMSPGVEEAGD